MGAEVPSLQPTLPLRYESSFRPQLGCLYLALWVYPFRFLSKGDWFYDTPYRSGEPEVFRAEKNRLRYLTISITKHYRCNYGYRSCRGATLRLKLGSCSRAGGPQWSQATSFPGQLRPDVTGSGPNTTQRSALIRVGQLQPQLTFTMGLLSRIQAELKGPKYITEAELDSSQGIIPLSRLDLNQVDCWRYRKIRGVNLGGSPARTNPARD